MVAVAEERIATGDPLLAAPLPWVPAVPVIARYYYTTPANPSLSTVSSVGNPLSRSHPIAA